MGVSEILGFKDPHKPHVILLEMPQKGPVFFTPSYGLTAILSPRNTIQILKCSQMELSLQTLI